uniref:NADH-ubiquinone oxidoreductase chain 2 n=1 Tax=Paraleuctra cercia TaxID=2778005 RepID=A0A7L8ZUL9_9NEOP|nr:NADH dehydrogenase subunit 2 [Paraleuctra cercia]QOI73889.1 NADH dehydrogenase subunit 2 [Paraleuctra cercia]
MVNNPTKMLFVITLISGSLIAISANSWFGAWIGLEINLLSFIPLMTNSSNLNTTEASLKYFLVQAIASAMLLYTVITVSLLHSFNGEVLMSYAPFTILLSSTLLLKTGAAPFHFWFPGVMEGLNWMTGLFLMTWQKIAPMILLSYTLILNTFTLSIIIICMIIGALGGLNQTSLRKILAYSSINHMGWMIAALITSNSLWILYFSLYTFLSVTIILSLSALKLFHINQIFALNTISPFFKFAIFTNFLSLGGLPPFIGFLPKWLVIQSLTETGLFPLIVIMVILTLITLFYYLRLTFTAFMLNYTDTTWPLTSSVHPPAIHIAGGFTMISIFGLLTSPVLFQYL